MAKRFKQSAIDAVPLLTENTERMSAADTGAGEESGGKKRFKTSALEAIQPKEQAAHLPGLTATEARKSLAMGVNPIRTPASEAAGTEKSVSRDQAVRDSYASRHPEMTGGEVGALTRERNTAIVLANDANRRMEEARARMMGAEIGAVYGAGEDDGSARAAYNQAAAERNALLQEAYRARNELALRRMEENPALRSSYDTAKTLRDDLERIGLVLQGGSGPQIDAGEGGEAYDYLRQKYGVDYWGLRDLRERLLRESDAAESALADLGIDYEDVSGYEQMLRDRERYQLTQAALEQEVSRSPADAVAGSVLSVLKAPLQGLDFFLALGAGAGRSDPTDPERYTPANIYGMEATNFVNTVRETVSKELEENTDWEIFGQNVASFLYQTGMSVADSATQVALFGPGATVLMGASAASNQARDVIERGGTNEQAFWGGLAAGAAETLFEKVSIDNLLKVKNVTGMRDLLTESVKQMGVEASEEMLTEISNILTDAAIMGGSSAFAQMVEQYEMQGLSAEEAKRQAYLDCIGQVAWAGVGGALSGAAMGGTVNTVNYARSAADARGVRNLGRQFQQMGDDVVAAIVQEGLESAPSTRSHQLAVQLREKQTNGQQVTARELGELYQENVRTVDREQSQQEAKEQEGISLPTVESILETTERAEPVTEPHGDTRSETAQMPAVSPLEAERPGQVQEPAAPETAQEAQRAPVDDILNGGVTNGAEGSAWGAGDGVLDGGQGRISGPGAGEQTRGLEAGAARTVPPAEQGRAAVERQNRGKHLRAEKVSSIDLGLPNGTETPSVSVVREADWDEGLRSTAERVTRETGLPVTYVLGRIQVRDSGGAVHAVRGVYSPRGIILQADNLRLTTDQIADHEIFHDKAFQTPGLVRELEARIAERYDRKEFGKVVGTYVEKLRGVVDLSENATPDEIDAAMQIIKEEIFADAYAGINAFAAHAERFQAGVNELLDDRGLGRETAAATERTTGPPRERYSYGGRNANQADSESLAEAERLEMQGVDPETIRQETGWFRGADDMWRFEIDDSGMEYDREGNMRGAVDRRQSYERENQAWKLLEETVDDEEWELLRQYLAETPRGTSRGTEQEHALYQELEERVGEPFTVWAKERLDRPAGGTEGGMLADFIKHDELFKNYPQLKNMPLRFESLESGLMGVYDGTEVVLSDTLRDAPEETLIHEVQHAIQRAEGFASGANPRYWERQLQAGYDGRTAGKRREAAELWEQYYSIRDNEPEFFQTMVDLDAMAPDVPRGEINWDTLEQIQEDPPEWQRYDAAREEAEEKYGDTKVWDFIDLWYRLKQAELTSDRGAYDLYRDTAGEIEARDAAARRTMTAEQRRQARPDTGNEDTVFAEVEDWMGDLDQEYGPQMMEEPEPGETNTQDGIERVASMEPVASITGEEFGKGDTDLITQVENFFNEHGNSAYNPQLGEVILDRRGVKSDIGHGIGRKKAAAFAAVPDIIAQGQVVDYQRNWKDRGYDTAVIAAPIQIGGQPYLAGVVVVRSQLTNRFYVHEVLTENDGATPFKTGAQDLGKPGGDTPSVISILGRIRNVKRGTGQTAQGGQTTGTRYSVDEDSQGREREEIDSRSLESYDKTTEATLTEDEEAAVLDYKSGGSYRLNAALRDGYPMDQSQYRTVEALDAALEKLPIYRGTVYRRLGFDSIGGQAAMDAFLGEHRAGRDVRYPAYTSSSIDPEGYPVEGELTVTMVIRGQNGRDLDRYGNNFEREILFPRNSRFYIERVEKDGTGNPVIHMEEVAERGTGQLYSEKQHGEMPRVQEVPEAFHLRGVPGVDPGRGDGQGLSGLRAEGAERETRGAEAVSQENDGRDGRARQEAGEEGLNGSDVRFSVDDEGDSQTEQQNEKEGRRTRRQRTARPVAESRPILAKKGLRQNLMGLFSIPDGMRAELGNVIDQYADRMLKAGALTEQDRTALFDRMYSSGVVTVPADDYFRTGREAVKGGRVYVGPKDQHEFGDDWNSFRKRAFAAGLYITNNPQDQGIDQWNTELADMLPGLFDADELDSRSILERIVQVAEEGKDEKVSLAEYTAQLAEEEYVSEDQVLDDMERKMDWALRTFAEKANLEIHLRDRTGVKIAQERERFAEYSKKQRDREALRRAEERDRRKAQIQRQRENRELRELQQRTLKQLQWLSKNRFRAPAELKAAWDEVLGDIDIYAAGAANEMNWSKRYGATWRDLAQMYKEAQKNDPNFLPSKELERIVMRLDGEKIADMDLAALQDLYRAAVGIRTEFYNRNNVINDELGRMFAEVYADAKQEIETAPGGYTGGVADRLFNLEQLTPMNILERMGGWNPDGTFYSMAKQLEKGERDVRAYTVEANRYLEDFLTEHADWVKRADGQGKDAIWYELEVPELLELGMGDKPVFGATKKVYMTPSQKVHLYLESKNTDNLRHMTGGRTFVNRDLYSRGKRQEALAQGTTIRLAPETVKKIVSDLTEEEMELARLLENYYNDFAARKINTVSNALYGYDKAMSRNYAPIYTNKNYTKSEIGVFDVTAEGVGNLKARQYAVNPSYNIGAFDAFERHVEQTARFVGMSVPARNWQTLLNWREKNNSTGDVITHKWGEEGKRYITDLIERLQGGGSIERDTVSTATDKLLSKYISAIFGANPSIVTKQFGSIFMAMPELGVRNIPTPAQLRSIDKDLIAKYTSELAWRGMGYATPETKQLKENPNWTQTNKFTRFTFGGGSIIAADQAAASVLWPWAENKVRREHPDLEVGTREQIDAGQSPFYQKVAQEFNDAVNRSQSVSDEIHQGKLRKSRNPITKTLTMFKSDSAQGYNQLRQRIGEARYYARSGADAETVRRARRAAGAAALGILTNNLWATAITFLIALWKNKAKYYRDEEEELTVGSVGTEMASTLFSSLAGLVAGGEELAEVIGNIVTGDTWYGIDVPGAEQVADLIELVYQQGKKGTKLLRGAVDILNNDGDLGEYLKANGGDIAGGVKELAQAAATYFGGIPVNNIEAYLLGLVKWVSPEVATAYESAFSSAQKSNLDGLTGEALAEQTGSLLDLRVGDTEEGTAEALAALYEQGYKKAVPSDVPSSVSVSGTDNELTPYQQQVYRDVWSGTVAGALDELVESDMFRDADAQTQESMLERLYEYGASRAKATLFEDYETESWVEGAEKATQAGISTAEWAAYYAMVSEIKDDRSMSSYQRGEAGRDLIRAADLTDQQKLTLYGAVYGSDGEGRTEKFRTMIDAGLTFGQVMDVYGKYAELEADEEAKVSDQTTDFHIWLNDQGFSSEQMEVIEGELGFWGQMKGQVNSKVVMANDYGIEPETYDAMKAAIAEIDTNGSTSQDEATAAINTLPGLTTRERAILWQLQNKGWSAEKNPFDIATGQEIYNAMHEEDEEEEEQRLPSLNLQDAEELPTLSLPTLD